MIKKSITDVSSKLWYNTSPTAWDEGLPIGNGRLAAMVLNYETEDVLTLNHEFLWTGIHKERTMHVTPGALEKTRALLKDEEYEEATLYAQDFLGRDGDKSKFEKRIDSFQPAGSLHVKFDNLVNSEKTVELKSRSLDIKNGVAASVRSYNKEVQEKNINGTYIAHSVYNNIICGWKDIKNAEIFFEREEDSRLDSKTEVCENQIRYNAKFKGGTAFCVDIKLFCDGDLSIDKYNRIKVTDAECLIAVINIATDVFDLEEEIEKYNPDNVIDYLNNSSWSEVLKSHTDKFLSYMDRVSLEINSDAEKADVKDITTDELLDRFKQGGYDDVVFPLYLNYGRYLLLSSSICGDLPANLQGKWNNDLNPAWDSDYHFDINIQMCYWLAENGNLSETTGALFSYMDLFEDNGRYAAKKIYGCRGLVLPLSTDCWGISTPESYKWDIWIGAAPWMAQHYYKHYQYTGDIKFLQDKAYPYFKDMAEFYEDYLVRGDDGIYQIMPSVSPENTFLKNPDIHISLGVSSAMDVQLAYDCLTYAIKSAEILNVDDKKIKLWKEIRDNLPEFKIGDDGRLLEWNKELYEREPGHRHLSHLYGVFPSDLFTPDRNKEQFEAAKKSLEYRLSHLGGHTGWSRAWVACLYARMGNSEEFYKHTRYLIDNFSTVSLLDLHPPRIFQIDGNLGGAEAIIQTLIHCRDGKVCLLPALPKKWHKGEINGIKTVGGHTVSFKWTDNKVSEVRIEFGYENTAVFDIDGKIYKISKESDKDVDADIKEISFLS